MVLFLAIIMVSLFISGMMMSQIMRQSYEDESDSQMVATARDVEAWYLFYNEGKITSEQLKKRLDAIAMTNQDSIWVVQFDNQVMGFGETNTSEGVDLNEIELYYNSMVDTLNESEGRPVRLAIQESNPFNTPIITVALPITYSDGSMEYIFINRRVSTLDASLINIYRQIVLSVAIAAVMAIILTYIFTRYMLRPLGIVTKGARQLARGHFDIWLEVRSEDEIGQLADTFNSVARDLKKYEQTRDSFVADVSHELRSPLTSVQGLVQGVMDGTIPEDEKLHYLGVALDETKRLNSLINNMLDLAKMESGQFPLQLEDIEVNELIRRVLITFESKIDVKNLMVEVEFANDKEYATADMNQIIQVVHNIMDNAIKFADYGGRLRISTLSTEDKVFVSINNSGEPIPREVIPYLFDRFYKGDKSRTRIREGAGIGLSLVKKILEEHRQKIWVESDRIGGTTFTFTLNKTEK